MCILALDKVIIPLSPSLLNDRSKTLSFFIIFEENNVLHKAWLFISQSIKASLLKYLNLYALTIALIPKLSKTIIFISNESKYFNCSSYKNNLNVYFSFSVLKTLLITIEFEIYLSLKRDSSENSRKLNTSLLLYNVTSTISLL